MPNQTHVTARIPIELLNDVKKIVKSKRYRNTTDFIVTAIRILVSKEKTLSLEELKLKHFTEHKGEIIE